MSHLAAALYRLSPSSGNSFTSPYPTYIEERPLYWQSRLFAQMQFLAEISQLENGRYDAALLPIVREAADRYRANGYVSRQDCLEMEQEALKIGIPVKDYRVICVGHAHMDMNWTWGYDETVQVVLDTLSTVLTLMREYPDFKFSQSQASVYRIAEEFGPPSLLDELRRRVQEGRLEVTASTWVEADKNMPGTESQVRQLLYAKRYLSRLLPVKEDDICIDFEPDTFGHSLHIPEILADAGIRYYYFNRGWTQPAISRWCSPSGALARLAGGDGYDRRAVGSGWKTLLFQQFHDILTGSCVRESREYALGCLQQGNAVANTVRQRALRALEEKVDTSCFANPAEDNPLLLGAGAGSGVERGQVSQYVRQANGGRTLFLWNPSAFERRETVEITVWDWSPRDVERIAFYDENGRQIPHQILTGGFNYYWSHSYVKALIQTTVPAFGYRTLGIREKEDLPLEGGALADGCQRLARPDEFVLENDLVRAVFSPRDGRLLSLTRLSDGHEYLDAARGGAGFRLVHEDTDKGMTAWIDGRWMTEEAMGDVHITRTAAGPLRQAIRLQTVIGHSALEVEITLDAGSPALTFTGKADWQESGVPGAAIPQLRFDAALAETCRRYRYDVPMGLTAREEANLDLPACTFAASQPDAAENALMLWTDSRHGFRGFDNSLGVTLIRSSYEPDPQPEKGDSSFVLKLAPADGTAAGILCRQAEGYDSPLQVVAGTAHPGSLPPCGSLIRVEGENAVVDSVKLAEDSDDLILRLHEVEGRCGTAVIHTGCPLVHAALTDLLERETEALLPTGENRLSVPLTPYSMKTIKIAIGG